MHKRFSGICVTTDIRQYPTLWLAYVKEISSLSLWSVILVTLSLSSQYNHLLSLNLNHLDFADQQICVLIGNNV